MDKIRINPSAYRIVLASTALILCSSLAQAASQSSQAQALENIRACGQMTNISERISCHETRLEGLGFGNSNAPVIGSSNAPVIGESAAPVIGSSREAVTGSSSAPVIGSSEEPVIGTVRDLEQE